MKTQEMPPGFCLGIALIDNQHARFFELMNRMIEADTRGDNRDLVAQIIAELVAYVADHFHTEEDLMARCGYPDLGEHVLLHIQFAGLVENFHTKYVNEDIGLDDEVLGYLVEWFSNHIRVEDPKYVLLARENGF